jgi:succinate dehydrogenase/fumarate reductase flavoprotein subunit
MRLDTDVLVLGGGPAGTWAAIAAAGTGADVVLADKGYCGTSGATASGGNNLWYLPEDPDVRDAAMAEREAAGGGLTDRTWMTRVQEETYRQVNRLAGWGYRFRSTSTAGSGATRCRGRSTCAACAAGCGAPASASSTTIRRWSC